MKYKKIALIVLIFLAIILLGWKFSYILPEGYWEIVNTVATVMSVVLILIELNEAQNLSEGSFVTGLSDSFNNNESIMEIYKKLELGHKITDDDTVDIVAYLTYFETLYVLLKKGAVDISLIDDLFAYRFKLALNNPDIRRISLVRYDYAYVNIYTLEKKWCAYKKQESILEKHNPNYPIILRGNKMKKNDIMYRQATSDDAEEIHSLMLQVYNNLGDKSIYVCDDLDYVRSCLSGGGFGVVACNKEKKIVGSFIMRYPGDSADNLGRDIGLPEEELCKVVHMESAVVLPEYRGNGIQQKMLCYAEELIDKGRYRYFMSTVSPDNPASFRSLEKNGYRHILTKEKYGGLMRRIYMKDISTAINVKDSSKK